MSVVTDPAFWLAVAVWLVVLVVAIGLCVAAACGDRRAEQARRDAARRISAGGGFHIESRRWDGGDR